MPKDEKSIDALAEFLEKILANDEVIGKIADKVAGKIADTTRTRKVTADQYWLKKFKDAGIKLDAESTGEKIAAMLPLQAPEIERVINRIKSGKFQGSLKLADLKKFAVEQLGEDVILDRLSAIKAGRSAIGKQALPKCGSRYYDYPCFRHDFDPCRWFGDICHLKGDMEPICIPRDLCYFKQDIEPICIRQDICTTKGDIEPLCTAAPDFGPVCLPGDRCALVDFGWCGPDISDPGCGPLIDCGRQIFDPCGGRIIDPCGGYYDPMPEFDPEVYYHNMARYRDYMRRLYNRGRRYYRR